MKANWGDATFEMCLNGSYGTVLSTLLRQRTQPFVFLDIGANQGLYSLIAAGNPNCAHVYAFEPVGTTFLLLEKNIELNGLHSKITPIKAAVSDSDANVTISVSDGHSGAASLHHGLSGNSELVSTVRMDTVASQIQPERLSIFAKVDVEGHELTVLGELARSCLSTRLEGVFYEVDEKWSDPRDLEIALAGLDFAFKKVGAGAHYDVLATRSLPGDN